MKKDRSQQELVSHDRWLLTYADLITLLLGLFVILYAMSNIDKKKYSQWVAAFGGEFGSGKMEMATGSSMLSEMSEQLRVEMLLKQVMEIDGKNSALSISIDERGVTIHIQEELLFPSGESKLKGSSYRMLDSLSAVLHKIPNDIRIEGHTDNIPIATQDFPTNWHLSVSRALNTGYYLIERHNFNPEKLSVVGYGDSKPIVMNTTENNRALNRRVDIVVLMSQVTQTLNVQRQQAIQGE
jgi:chemotaxis protein MotB